jgi:hypothetical protein
LRLTPFAQNAYDGVKAMCDWRLGRTTLITMDDQPLDLKMTPKTLDEMIAYLQRILRSIELWQKEGGRHGYYNFVREYLK